MKETNIEHIKSLALAFLELPPEPVKELPLFVNHPYFNSAMSPYKDDNGEIKFADIVNDAENLERVKEPIRKMINSASVDKIFMLMQPQYHLVFLKYAKQYMSKDNFDKRLADIWVRSENPNQDINVKIPTLIRWFRKADRRNLMNADELAYYNSMPDRVQIYRGVSVGRAGREGLSWTRSKEKAEWFAHRFDTKDRQGYVIAGAIDKPNVFAYFNRRNEEEVLCDSSKITII